MSRRNEWTDIFLGIGLLLMCHLIAFVVFAVLVSAISALTSGMILPAQFNNLGILATIALLAWGVTQLIYVIPLVVVLARRRRYGIMKGVIVGAVLTALLNGGCWLYFTNAFKL